MYVEYSNKLKEKWKLCRLEDIHKYVAEEFYKTWQVYTDAVVKENGAIYGNWVFDFDGDIEEAKQDCIAIYDFFLKKGVKDTNITAYFSGSKGFHIEIDYRSYMDKPEFDLHLIYKYAYSELDKLIKNNRDKSTMDGSIYSIRRMFRYPNSRHPKTGLYCVPLTREDLNKAVGFIKLIAENTKEIKDGYEKDDALIKLFENAKTHHYKKVSEYEEKSSVIFRNTGNYPPCINNMLKEGVKDGERNRSIYLLARALKQWETDETVKDKLVDYANRINLTSQEALATARSALKRPGSFLSCLSMYGYCDKTLCETLKDTKHIEQIESHSKYFEVKTLTESKKDLVKNIKEGKYDRKIKTGIKHLDNCSLIVQDSVVVLASLSNIGKTSLAITMINNNQDKKILYLSIEEGQDRGALRLLMAGIKNTDNILIASKKFEQLNESSLRALFHHYNDIDMIIIDQLINLDSKSKEERLKYRLIMEELRVLCRTYKTPALVIHQLNRQAVSADEPVKEMLAEGADIERLAYDVWLLYRVKINEKTVNIIKIDKSKFTKVPLYIPVQYDVDRNIFKSYDFSDFDSLLTFDEMEALNISRKEIEDYDVEKHFKQKINKIES